MAGKLSAAGKSAWNARTSSNRSARRDRNREAEGRLSLQPTAQPTDNFGNSALADRVRGAISSSNQFMGNLPINSQTLRNVQPITLPEKPVVQDVGNIVQGNNAAIASSMADQGYNYDKGLIAYNSSVTNFLNRLNASTPPPNTEALYKQAENRFGLSNLKRDKQVLVDRLNSITAQAQADVLATQGQGRGITESIIGGQQAQINREAAIKALPIQAELNAVQGNLDIATSQLDTVFRLKAADAQAQYDYKSKLIDSVYDFLDNQEKKRADELKASGTDSASQIKFAIDKNREAATQALKDGDSARYNALVNIPPPKSIEDLPSYNRQLSVLGGGSGGGTGQLSNLAQSIVDNPSLYDDLTPTVRGKILGQLQSAGYDTTNLGVKSLSDTAIKEVSQTQKALDDLNNLRGLITGQENLLGPIQGLQRFNPYSPARKLQADVDRVRQTVGKALEGGVLRKEDEEKYKKILATLADTPSTAIYKVDALISSLERDIANYKTLQQASGRSLNVREALGKKGGTTDFRSKYNY